MSYDNRKKLVQPDPPEEFFIEADSFWPVNLRDKSKDPGKEIPQSEREECARIELRKHLIETYAQRLAEFNESLIAISIAKEKSVNDFIKKLEALKQ